LDCEEDLTDQTKTDHPGWILDIARLIEGRHGRDIVLLDVRDISPVADYFLVATGTSSRQLVAIADELKQIGKKNGNPPWKIAGRDTGQWVVVDFVDIVVHLFSEELRNYYELEMVWGQADRVEWRDNESPESS